MKVLKYGMVMNNSIEIQGFIVFKHKKDRTYDVSLVKGQFKWGIGRFLSSQSEDKKLVV